MSINVAPPKVRQAETVPEPAASTAQSASLLEASRRVDWRFLLPDPTLGRVALVGRVSESLRESLMLFSERLTQTDPALRQDGASVQYDLVVICGSLDQRLVPALELVKPGGFVYIEFRSSLGGGGFPLLHPLAYNTKLLKHQGFTKIQCHWHSPSFEACKRIIPIDNPSVLVHMLNKSHGGMTGLLTKAGVLLVYKSGLLCWSGRALSLIAERGAA